MTYLKDSSGAALPLTLVVILVLAILGVSLLTVASSSHSMQASQHRRLAARHIAEGGAETVYQAIKTSSSSVVYGHPFTVNLGNQPGNPTASVTVEELEDDTVLITSTGTYGSASATVKLAAIPGLPEVYTLGVYAGEGIHGKGDGKKNVVLGADIVSGGEIDGWSAPGHNVVENSHIAFPTVNRDDYESWPPPQDNGDKNHREIRIGPTGKAFLPNDVEAKNNLKIYGPGTLVIDGGLTEKNNITIHGAVTLIVIGDLTGKNNLEAVELTGSQLNLVVTGNVTLGNNSKVFGNIVVGGSLTVDQNTEVKYSPPVLGLVPDVIGGNREWSRVWIR